MPGFLRLVDGAEVIEDKSYFAALHESAFGPFRKSRDVRLESGMQTKADIEPQF
jgi:hypothetical protein